MTLDRISINKTIANVEQLLKDDPALSPALHAAIEMLILAVQLLADRAKLDSRNSRQQPILIARAKPLSRVGEKWVAKLPTQAASLKKSLTLM